MSKVTRGKRYTSAEKAEILTFVDQHNAENKGRGGAATASRKFKVSQLTISNWLRDAGGTGSNSKAKNADISQVLKKLGEVHKKMAKVEDELSALRKEYSALKSQL
jgi:hypothetical protein